MIFLVARGESEEAGEKRRRSDVAGANDDENGFSSKRLCSSVDDEQRYGEEL